MTEISSMLRRASATTALCLGPTFVGDLQEGERFNMDAAGRGVVLGICSTWRRSLDRWKGAYLGERRRNSFENHTGTHWFPVLNLRWIWAIMENYNLNTLPAIAQATHL